MTALLSGKTALIFGVANKYSIAWGIARMLHQQGCEVVYVDSGWNVLDMHTPLEEDGRQE